MPTIFITSFHVLISRNILASTVLDLLRARGWRVVILVPEKKREFFTREFGGDSVSVEGVATDLSKGEIVGRYLSLAALRTQTLSLKRKTELGGQGTFLARIGGGTRWLRLLVRALDPLLTPRGRFSSLLDRERPSLVFATDVQNENDIRLMREAKSRAIPSAGMVRSWDNLTSKGLMRAVPDILLVHNRIVKEEAIRLHGIPEEKIRVIGVPHYDRYDAPAHPRAEFENAVGLKPGRKFVLYAPVGDRYLSQNRVDQWMVSFILKMLPPEYDLLIRLPPTDSVHLEGGLPDRAIIHRTGQAAHIGARKLNELTRKDDELLRDSLAYAELVIAGPSTILVDAAVFDKPAIAVAFDGDTEPRYEKGLRRYYDYEHMQEIRRSGGVRIVNGSGELKIWMGRYLENPNFDAEGRKRIREDQCGVLDGSAGRRLADLLAAAAEGHKHPRHA